LKQEYLSDIELYFATKINRNSITITGDESKHIAKVMRHTVGDILHATDGAGNYFETTISEITKNSVIASINSAKKYFNNFEKIYFCFPRLKSSDRFEFELEKSIELGITNFIIFHSERTIPKGDKLERWNKIALAAMKQSLRTFLPKIEYASSLKKINSLNGRKIIFDQKGSESLIQYINESKGKINSENHYLIFGPEGGLSQKEINSVDDSLTLTLTQNRLRAETSVIATATAISLL
jgi:16S rRNA (uracil1498-N3)-methyltransferase